MKTFQLLRGLALGAVLAASFAAPTLAHDGPHDAPKHDAPKPETPGTAAHKTKVHKIKVVVDGGYAPHRLNVKRGEEVQLTFVRQEKGGCGNVVRFANLTEIKDGKEIPVERTLKTGEETTVTFTPKAKGTLNFTCGMGMYKGAILVK